MRRGDIAAAVGLSALAFSSPARAIDCEGLKSAKIADTTIISAEAVPAGDLTTTDKVTRKDMPAFCRVVATRLGPCNGCVWRRRLSSCT